MTNNQSSLTVLLEHLDKAKNPDRLYPLIHPLLGTPTTPTKKVARPVGKNIEEILRGMKRYKSGFTIEDDRRLIRGEKITRFNMKACADRRSLLRQRGINVPYQRVQRNNLPEFGSNGTFVATLEELDEGTEDSV